MSISRKLRNQAILVASAEACNPDCAESSSKAAKLLGLPQEAGDLAYEAWKATADATYDEPSPLAPLYYGQPLRSAEAEALLRSGWSPGEPVEVL